MVDYLIELSQWLVALSTLGIVFTLVWIVVDWLVRCRQWQHGDPLALSLLATVLIVALALAGFSSINLVYTVEGYN